MVGGAQRLTMQRRRVVGTLYSTVGHAHPTRIECSVFTRRCGRQPLSQRIYWAREIDPRSCKSCGFRSPSRRRELTRQHLVEGLRVKQPMTLITIGRYKNCRGTCGLWRRGGDSNPRCHEGTRDFESRRLNLTPEPLRPPEHLFFNRSSQASTRKKSGLPRPRTPPVSFR